MKSIRISKFSSIKSKNIFIDILLHIFSAYMIVCSENCSLQVGPSIFNTIIRMVESEYVSKAYIYNGRSGNNSHTYIE